MMDEREQQIVRLKIEFNKKLIRQLEDSDDATDITRMKKYEKNIKHYEKELGI
jgi:hypothetical protein